MFRQLCFSFVVLTYSYLAQANVLGDMQTFSSNTDGLDFITVHSARPLQKGYLGLNTHITYAKNHLLVYSDPIANQNMIDYADQLSDVDLSISYGLTENLQLFLYTNFLIWQQSDRVDTFKVDITRGMNVNRPGIKWTFSEDWRMAFIGSVDFMHVHNDPYTGVDSKPIYNLEFAKNFGGQGGILHAFNLGYRIRTPTERPIDARMYPLDDQLTVSYGATDHFSDNTRWIFEIIGSYPLQKGEYKDAVDASSLDLLLAVNHNLSKNMLINAGATVEPFVKTLSPSYRVFAGLTMYLNLFGAGQESGTTEPKEEKTVFLETPQEKVEEIPLTAAKISLKPGTATVYEGSRLQFQAKGGTLPYRYEIISGDGTVQSDTGEFRAALNEGETTVLVTDANGETAEAMVITKKIPKEDKKIRLKNLHFIFNTDKLTPSSKKNIDTIVSTLREFRIRKIVVEGHTDSKGSNQYNLELSQSRADRVKNILQKALDLGTEQVEAIGFGEERPIATNATEQGRTANRRVDLKIYFKK
ncbi:MAG: OmpA family protein [Bdellovibrionaceae bacterium]|nr:OmpA family protein [Pseudobdellovibrionaceae bacterium]